MKKRDLLIAALVIVFFGILTARDSLARVFWHEYGRADIAVWLAGNDSEFLMQLGNYYFNGGAYDLSKAAHAYKKALEAEPGIL